MNIFTKLASLGIKEEMGDDIKMKVTLGNILTIALIILMLAYSIISAFILPELLKYCFVGLGLYILNLVVAKMGFNVLARFLIATLPAIVVGILHAAIIQNNEVPLKEIYTFQFVAVLVPFTVFDFKRVQYWLPAFIIALLPIILIDSLNNYIDVVYENKSFQEPWARNTVLFGAIFLGAFLIVFLQRLNQRQFNKVSLLVKNIEAENQKAAEKEEALKNSLTELEKAQEEEKKRVWATTGLAEIGGLLRGENDLKILTEKIVSHMVKYLKASQGALFLLEGENPDDLHLSLKAAYAFNRKKHLNRRVDSGQGLVGQCYLEKNFIYLTDVPENFISIKSGLGDANPRSILITPMIVNEEVYGIFEIASFQEIPQYQIDFMMELGENIAMTLNSFKINEKTKHLLSEMQEQSEQLRSQEEEMRQNMEELQATQEQQERQEQELRQQLDKVESEKNIIEEREKQLLKELAILKE
ncbi:GAF domain-containing protein [Marivirga sp. S37H4]|uniref:GAF domain-containing protein n=1 Tax=Marivirga aurantiaca TaxID=2802615 RepID=A0A935C978_9BACT|nr:GAF domain-containing protein [Marivirga aurantiaca]MBK6265900.1 GAF domain-containing protein [Marivirga aurantiaca]